MQIIVLGNHRSGTSAITRLINMMGAYVGEEADLIGANDENPKGFWERGDVIAVNDAILARAGAGWYDLADWKIEDHLTPAPVSEIEQAMQPILSALNRHSDWVTKDPRLCLTLGYWKPHLPKPVIVMVHRDSLEVAQSLKSRNGMPLAVGLALWECYARSSMLLARGMPVLHVDYKALMTDPVAAVKRLCSALVKAGATTVSMPDEAAITAFVEPGLYRSKTSAMHQDVLHPLQLALLLGIERGNDDVASVLSSGAADAIGLYSRLRRKEDDYEALAIKMRDLEGRHQMLEEGFAFYKEAAERTSREMEAIQHTRTWRLRNQLLKLLGKR